MNAVQTECRFKMGDRVRIRPGMSVDSGRTGEVIYQSENGPYYGILLDCHHHPLGFSDYELESEDANPEAT